MKSPLTALVSARIGTQIAALVVGALVLAQVAMTVGFFVLDPVPRAHHSPFGVAERLAFVARMLDAEPNRDSRETLLAQAKRVDPGLTVLQSAPPPNGSGADERMLRDMQAIAGPSSELFLARLNTDERLSAVVKLSDGTFLAAALSPPPMHMFLLSPTAVGALAFLAIAVILLSLWTARQLTTPLSKFADAAERFTADATAAPIAERGPLEVRRAAKALNDMQARVSQLVADRTRMLAAVGHDLRTPITRLRLRTEDIADGDLRAQFLRDLATMEKLVQSALSFLRGQHEPGPKIRTDLPALVQTVCDGFSDMGHTVRYSGPPHLYNECEPDQLMRALENLIDNGLKFGSSVVVRVDRQGPDAIIEIEDDGPGIADAEKRRVMEPFYRGDSARDLNEGDSFGLGLSIAGSIVERNGGRLELLDHKPCGLIARIALPALA